MNSGANENKPTSSGFEKLAIRFNGWRMWGILLLGFGQLTCRLTNYAIWGDEAWSMWAIGGRGIAETWVRVANDVHPPLYFLLLDGWVVLVGDSVFAIRLLSALFGIIAIALTFALGHTLFDKQVGWIGALLLATTGFFVRYGVETRMYSLLLCLAVLATLLFVRWVHRPTLWRGVAYSLAAAGLGYTHYYGWLVVAGHGVWWGVMSTFVVKIPVFYHRVLMVIGLVGLWYVPWMPAFFQQLFNNPNGPLTTPVPTNWDTIGWLLTLLAGGLGGWWLLIPVFTRPPQTNKNRRTLLIIWFVLTPIVVLTLNVWRPSLYETRYMVGIVPAFSLFTAYFIRHIKIVPLKIVLLIIIPIIQINNYGYLFPPNLIPTAVQTVLTERQLGEPSLVKILDSASLAAYHDRQYGLRDVDTIDLSDRTYSASELEGIIAGISHPSVWLIMPYNIPETWTAINQLQATRGVGYRANANLMQFYRFDTDETGELNFSFGEEMAFLGWENAGSEASICPKIQLQALKDFGNEYSFGIHLVDDENVLVGQVDAGISVKTTNETFTVEGCLDTPIQSPYHLHLVIYNWQTQTRLPVLENESIPWGDALIFHTIPSS